jgi:hypothetical protein
MSAILTRQTGHFRGSKNDYQSLCLSMMWLKLKYMIVQSNRANRWGNFRPKSCAYVTVNSDFISGSQLE